MALNEKTFLGVVYFSWATPNRASFPPHVVGVIQQERPWRRGKALFFPWWSTKWWQPRGVLIGLWFPRLRAILHRRALDDEWDDALWFSAKHLDIPRHEISLWSNGAEPNEESETDWSEYRIIRYEDQEDGDPGATGHAGHPVDSDRDPSGSISTDQGGRLPGGDEAQR